MIISAAAKPKSVSTVDLNRLTASEIARSVASGQTRCEALMRDCLARIEAHQDRKLLASAQWVWQRLSAPELVGCAA